MRATKHANRGPRTSDGTRRKDKVEFAKKGIPQRMRRYQQRYAVTAR